MKQKILWRLVAVGNGTKTLLFDVFSAFAKGIPLRFIGNDKSTTPPPTAVK